jgi:transposase-like protein
MTNSVRQDTLPLHIVFTLDRCSFSVSHPGRFIPGSHWTISCRGSIFYLHVYEQGKNPRWESKQFYSVLQHVACSLNPLCCLSDIVRRPRRMRTSLTCFPHTYHPLPAANSAVHTCYTPVHLLVSSVCLLIGGVERGTGRSFFVPVRNRSNATLTVIIRAGVEPGTTIISDCWAAYNDLGRQGYTHQTVNHRIGFVDQVTGAHTNTIESYWHHLKEETAQQVAGRVVSASR